MGETSKTGGENGSASTALPGRKLATSKSPRMLEPFEIRGPLLTTTVVADAHTLLLDPFWPSSKHRFGWYLDPSYGYDFWRGHEQSLGMSVVPLIAVPSGKR